MAFHVTSISFSYILAKSVSHNNFQIKKHKNLSSLDRKKIKKTKNNKQLNFPVFALLNSVGITTVLLRRKHKIY